MKKLFIVTLMLLLLLTLAKVGQAKTASQLSNPAKMLLESNSFPLLKRAMIAGAKKPTRAMLDGPGDCCPPFTATVGCSQVDDGRFFVIFYCFCVDLSGHVYLVTC